MIVTICGSMRFFKRMLEVAQSESEKLNIVLMPFVYFKTPDEQDSELKKDLDVLHYKKIDMSQAIVVVTVNGYIGESTRSEIIYAARVGLQIQFVNFEE